MDARARTPIREGTEVTVLTNELGVSGTEPDEPAHNEAIRRLYEREHAAMVRLAHLILASKALADEVVHDAFVSLLERPTGIDNPGAYLRRTVVNACNSSGRRTTTGRAKLRIVADRERDASVALPPEIDETWIALSQLKPDQRTALALRYYEDLPVNEIAELMDARPGTVKSLIHRGLKALEKEMNR